MLSRQAHRRTSLCASRTYSLLQSHNPIARQFWPWRCRGLEVVARTPRQRNLATAVSDFNLDGSPFNLSNSALPAFASSSLRSLDIFDPSTPLTIPEPDAPPVATKINKYGIPGDAEDMLPVFAACIRVGKLDRAALVLKRFNATGTLSGEERILLHNQYLRTSLLQMRTSPDRRQAEQLHKWYELQIRSKKLPHTAETIACMLKASLLSERGPRLGRLIKRYMGMAPGESGLRVLSMADLLSDQDLAVITNICPTYNFAMEVDEVDTLDSWENDSEPHATEFELTESSTDDLRNAAYRNLPDLRETPQRGEGLSTLKQGLRVLDDLQDVDISRMPEADRREIQARLERDAIDGAIERWRSINKDLQKMGINTAISPSSRPDSLSQHMASWLGLMEQKLKEELILVRDSENKSTKNEHDLERCVYGPLIQQADPARLAALTILCVLNLGATQGMDKGIIVSRVISSVATLAQEDIEAQREVNETKTKEQRANVSIADSPSASKASQPAVTARSSALLIQESPETMRQLEKKTKEPWSTSIKAKVGSILLKTFLETAKIKVNTQHPASKETISQLLPAFSHMLRPRKGKKVGVLYPNTHLLEQLKKEPTGDFLAKHLPMIVEPKPWRRFNEGGFLESKTALVRVRPGDVEQTLYINAAVKNGDLEQVLKGLDALGKTAWRINQDVLNVMMAAWNSGEEIANMPPLNPTLDIPDEPEHSADPLLHKRWQRTVVAIENRRSGLHSQRCFMNLQLEIARAFRNQTVYFPHNVDYRGRAYPMPTYLNHIGADHTRAILKFAKGKLLGARGLRWLKIHLANLHGLGKRSFDEREGFANDNVANIVDSATRPLDGKRWWLSAEDPWQCLAACFELKAALDMPDPTQFVSQLPVHQDGTCNGLQHYAALGGDTWGARQVNLEPADRPADVYSAVASLVEDAINKDAKTKIGAAVALQGKITRKIVKQTVMTNVYGVTFAGAKKQVCKQIDAFYPSLGKDCGIPNMVLSTYVAKHIFKALQSMFSGAHDIQYWLGDIGSRVCRALTASQLRQLSDKYAATQIEGEGGRRKRRTKGAEKTALDELTQQFRSTVVWTTPLRMPVVQPYRKRNMREIRTCLQAVLFMVNDRTDAVNRRKQLQGFPPNFIHSLDASHMLLSALRCHEQGLDFAAVHDSFWTHAADIDTMNTALRETFIQIHKEDVVGRLAKEFEVRHKGSLYLSQIDSQSPIAIKIKELRKKSNLSLMEELLLEHKRNSLRLSGNPWDLEAAQKIVTPASVYEQMSSHELKADQDVTDHALDDVAQNEVDELDDDDDADFSDAVALALEEEQLQALEEEQLHLEGEDSPAAYTDRLVDRASSGHFKTHLLGETTKASAKKPKRSTIPVWLPLTIPTIPKKGDFDVNRVRESKYFFS